MRLFSVLAALFLVLTGFSTDHYPPWTTFHAEAMAFVASALLFVATLAMPFKVRATFVFTFFALLVLTAWLQWGAGVLIYAGDAWMVTAYVGIFYVAWQWGYGAVKSGQPELPIYMVCSVLVILGALTAFQVLSQWLLVADRFGGWIFSPQNPRPSGNWGQPNHAATLLLMSTAAVAILMVHRRLSRPVAWLLIVLLGWAMVLTQSRTSLLAASLMAAIILCLSIYKSILKPYRKDVVAWVAFICAALWLIPHISGGEIVQSIERRSVTEVGGRPLLWLQIWTGLLEKPWLGFGWLQVPGAQQAGAINVAGFEQASFSHNIIMDVMVFLGIPGGLLVLALAVAWLLRRIQRPGATNTLAFAALLVLIPFLVHAQLELPHTYAYFLVPAGILLGAFDGQTEREEVAHTWRIPRWMLTGACVLWITMLGALGYEYALAEEDFRVNRFENKRLGQTSADYQVPVLHGLTQLQEALQAMRIRAVPDMPAEELALLMRVSSRYTWAPMHYRTALALGLNGHPEQAAHQLLIIKSMFPRDVYEEGKSDWLRMSEGRYPQLKEVVPP